MLKTPKNEAASFLRCLSQQLIDDSSILMPFNVLMSVGVKSRALTDGDPDGFTPPLSLDDFLFQAVKPDAAINHLPHELVLAYEDATFGVF